MYRILLVDDDKSTLDEIKRIIINAFPGEFEISAAESGFAAVSYAELIHPEIIYMDIEMSGVNGIQLLKEIKCSNPDALICIVSACERFDIVTELIQIGIERYLKKPFTGEKMAEVTYELQSKVDHQRKKYSEQLKIQKKLDAVLPVMENWFVSSVVLHNDWKNNTFLKSLMDLRTERGYFCVFQIIVEENEGKLFTHAHDNLQDISFYAEFRSIVKSYLNCLVGNIISNRIAIVVPYMDTDVNYAGQSMAADEKMDVQHTDTGRRTAVPLNPVELMYQLEARLEEKLGIRFRIGIGRVRVLDDLRASYHDANIALQRNEGNIVYIGEIGTPEDYTEEYPIETEKNILRMLDSGSVESLREEGTLFYDWVIRTCNHDVYNIRMRIIEFLVWTEREVLHESEMSYGFSLSENYLDEVKQLYDFEDLRRWFLNKLTEVCKLNQNHKEEPVETVVSKAQEYIAANYQKDITLEEISRMVNISPYYFSKLFKGETGENFIDYLTRIRVDRAVKLLEDRSISIKEISLEVGYADPNYFSRLFKKRTGMTPREYRNKS